MTSGRLLRLPSGAWVDPTQVSGVKAMNAKRDGFECYEIYVVFDSGAELPGDLVMKRRDAVDTDIVERLDKAIADVVLLLQGKTVMP